MYERLCEVFVDPGGEAEPASYLDKLRAAFHALLSVSRHLPQMDDQSYNHIWRSKAAMTRIQQRRRRELLFSVDPASHDLWQALLSTRRELAEVLLAPAAPNDAARRKRAQELNEAK